MTNTTNSPPSTATGTDRLVASPITVPSEGANYECRDDRAGAEHVAPGERRQRHAEVGAVAAHERDVEAVELDVADRVKETGDASQQVSRTGRGGRGRQPSASAACVL